MLGQKLSVSNLQQRNLSTAKTQLEFLLRQQQVHSKHAHQIDHMTVFCSQRAFEHGLRSSMVSLFPQQELRVVAQDIRVRCGKAWARSKCVCVCVGGGGWGGGYPAIQSCCQLRWHDCSCKPGVVRCAATPDMRLSTLLSDSQLLRFIGTALDAEAEQVIRLISNGTLASTATQDTPSPTLSRQKTIPQELHYLCLKYANRPSVIIFSGSSCDKGSMTTERRARGGGGGGMKTCRAALNAASLAPASCTTSHRNVA
jgi:hypothetical protein